MPDNIKELKPGVLIYLVSLEKPLVSFLSSLHKFVSVFHCIDFEQGQTFSFVRYENKKIKNILFLPNVYFVDYFPLLFYDLSTDNVLYNNNKQLI